METCRWKKEDMKPSTYRRVVTMNVDGKSVVQSDEQMQAYQFRSVPDYEHTLMWVNPTTPDPREEQRLDRYPSQLFQTWWHKSSLHDVSAKLGLCGPVV
jgi:hypothetical protein